MKKQLTTALLLFFALSLKANVTLGFSGEEAASVGIYVKDLSTGSVIAENDSQKALLPASILKSLTAATSLSILGEDFTFRTKVVLEGARDGANSTLWNGNLVINAVGDPSIDSELFRDRPSFANEIKNALQQKGISAITGKIIIEQPMSGQGCIPEWEIDDVAWAYGAGLFGFNYKDNKYRLWPASGRTEPYIPGLEVELFRSSDGTDLVRGIFSDQLRVYCREPENRNWTVNPSMSNPAEAFKIELTEKLRANGIEVYDRETPRSQNVLEVFTHVSPSIVDILHQMMIESHNMFAEAMLRAIMPEGSRDKAIDKEMRFWRDRGVPVNRIKVCDGSGLARADRVQARFMGAMLESMLSSSHASTYVSLFPKVGVEGTVKSLLKDTSLKGKLALKSGSMNGVQCFAGYKLGSDGQPTHVVVIIVNSFFCSRGELRGTIENFLLETFTNQQ